MVGIVDEVGTVFVAERKFFRAFNPPQRVDIRTRRTSRLIAVCLHCHADLTADVRGFHIEVVEDFHVIAQKTDRTQDHRVEPSGTFGAQVVADVGLEPWIARAAAAALEDEDPVLAADCARNERGRGAQLRFVRIPLRHRDRNAVRGEHEPRPLAAIDGQAREGRAHVISVRLDEPVMFVPVADAHDVHVGQTGQRQDRPRIQDILAILRASGIATLRGGQNADRAADSGARHRR
jgi:hypothetical protein